MAEIRGALTRASSLSERLFIACDLWLVQVFDLQRRTPDARDMDDLSIPVVRRVYAELEALIAELIDADTAKPLPANAEMLARGLVFAVRGFRSEEHTSELQSLMRSSYAVFCLT